MDEVTQSSLINICISDEILREIDITVEPSPDGRININIARRQQRIPDHQSDSLSMDYYSSPEVYINRPAITAWAVDVATHTADLDLIEHIEQMYEYYTAQSYESDGNPGDFTSFIASTDQCWNLMFLDMNSKLSRSVHQRPSPYMALSLYAT
ncbi:hypothetical protein CFE70_006326 [Pyrenophora teres f. teres 0-1]